MQIRPAGLNNFIYNFLILIYLSGISGSGESSQFKFEPATGSFWYSSDGGDGELLEWKNDNTLTTHRAPFTNLYYPESKVPFAGNDRILTKTHGNFAIWYKYRTFFRRQNGVMVREEFFDQNQNFGCTDGPAGNCMFFQFDIQNIGPGVVVFSPPDFDSTIWIEDNGSYRSPTEFEQAIFSDEAEASWISPDGTYGVVVRESDPVHTVVLKKGVEEYSHDIETAIVDTNNQIQLLTINNKQFLYVGYSSNQGTGSSGRKIRSGAFFRLHTIDFDGTALTSRLVLQGTVNSVSMPNLMGFSQDHLTVAAGSLLVNFPMNGSAAETIYTCDQFIQINEPVERENEVTRTGICAQTFLAVRPGSVSQQIEFPFNIAQADYVDDFTDDRLVMAISTNKQVELVFANRQRRSLHYGSTQPDPVLAQSWTENGAVCGVSMTTAADTYICKNLTGTWDTRSSSFGIIADVVRLKGSWWLVSTAIDTASVYNLVRNGNGTEDWVLQDAVPAILEKNPKFVSTANLIPALDTGGGFTYLLEGSRLIERYQRTRPAAAFELFNPVIDSEGRLYDFGEISENVGKIFFYQPDGTAFNTELQTYAYGSNNQALKRGVLLQDFLLFRAEKYIPLHELFGELRVGHTPVALENNTRAFYFSASQTTSGFPELYTYDGIRFELASSRIQASEKNKLNSKRPQLPKSLQKFFGETPSVPTGRQIIFKDHLGMWVSIGGGETIRSGNTLENLLTNSSSMNADNHFFDAMTHGNRLLAVNSKGVWSCPAGAVTPVDEQTFDIPVSVGCQLKRADYGIRKISGNSGKFVILQGHSLLLLNHLGDVNPVVLSQSQTVTSFSIQGRRLYWSEPGKLYVYDFTSGDTGYQESTLDLTGAYYVAGWLCGKQGLFWNDGQTTVQILSSCDFLNVSNSVASVVSGKQLMKCANGHCSDPVPLPLPWRRDCTLGAFFDGETNMTIAAFASQLYQQETGGTILTPLPLKIGAGKNLIFAPITRINQEFIMTEGGGLIRLDSDHGQISAGMLRLE